MIGKISYRKQTTALVEVVGLESAKELHSLLEQITESEDAAQFDSLIRNPLITSREKSEIMEELLATKFKGEELVRINNFFKLLFDKSSLDLNSLMEALGKSVDVATKTEKAVISVCKVSEDVRSRIKQFSTSLLGNKIAFENLDIEWIEDAKLLGGFLLRHEFFEFDYSVRGKITDLKKALTIR